MNGDDKKGLSLYDILFGNQSAEADSLQEDSRRRLQEGGLFGKKGREASEWFKGLFENSNVEVPVQPGWTEDELKYGRMRQGYTEEEKLKAQMELMQKLFPIENLIPGLGAIGRLKKVFPKKAYSKKTDLSSKKTKDRRVVDAEKSEITAMQDWYRDPGLRQQKRWADLTIKELIRSMRRGKK